MSPIPAGVTGSFHYTVPTRAWWWSDSVYRIHGFEPGAVVPTPDLVAAHQHPDEHESVIGQVLDRNLRVGESCAVWHRLVDARRHTRQVVTLAEGARSDERGRLEEVRGWLIDVTATHRQVTAAETDEAVRRSAESRASIEQAKGALMVTMRLTPQQAFELLKTRSQNLNLKLRVLAQRVVDGLASGEPEDVRRRVSALLSLDPSMRPEQHEGAQAS